MLIFPGFWGFSHSDINLVELEKETIKDEDRAALLEGGGLTRSASTKSHSISVKTNLIRSPAIFILMEFHFDDLFKCSYLLLLMFLGFLPWMTLSC